MTRNARPTSLRRRLQLLVVVGCLGWGGYQLTSATLASPAGSPDGGTASVRLDSSSIEEQYPALPPSVARSIPAVVATFQRDDGGRQGSVASGVIINSQQILTAGHSVESAAVLDCARTIVVAPGLLTSAAASSDPVTHASVHYGTSSDIAVLTLRASDNFRSLPAVSLAARQPEAGDTVYFVNFQPAADGHLRSPASQSSARPDNDYSKPAVFSGIVIGDAIGNTAHGTVIATGNGASLGAGVAGMMVRKGASGGAVFDRDGKLAGLSVSSQSLETDRTAASIVKQYGVALREGRYQLANMQPVSPAMVHDLQAGMTSCASGL